jgi:hypothetical protein
MEDIKKIKRKMEDADRDIALQRQKLSLFKEKNKPKSIDDTNKEIKSLKQLRDNLKKELWEKYKEKYEIFIRPSK